MTHLNEITEIHQHLAANKGKPLVIDLPPRVELKRPLNLKHDSDITLTSVQGTEIYGEQIYIESPGVVSFDNLAHFGFSLWSEDDKASWLLGYDRLEFCDGRCLIGKAKAIKYNRCTMLNYMDDAWGGSAERFHMYRCLVGHTWRGDKGGLVSKAKNLTIEKSVFVNARYRQPCKATLVDEVTLRQNVIVQASFHMESSGVKTWLVDGNWFWPERMGLHRPICPGTPGVAFCCGNWLHGDPALFGQVFGTLRGRNDLANRPQVSHVGEESTIMMSPDFARKVIEDAGASGRSALSMLAKRTAIEMGGLS